MPTRETPLRIAHVDAEQGFSGGEVQVFLLMEGLRARGHTNILLCPPDSRAAACARERAIEVRGVPMRGDLDWPAVRRLGRELERVAVDLVHLHTGRATWLGGWAAWRKGLPALTTRRMDRRVRRGWRTRLIYERFVARAVAISDAVRACLVEGGVAPERIRTIPSAVDPGALRPERERSAVRAELGLAERDVCVLALASLVPRKGLDVLIDALAACDPAVRARTQLRIAGEGPEREALETRAAQEAAGHVRFLGQRSDKGELLAAADVVAMPSQREGLGVAALEAMAAGRPVLASRVGGLAQVVVHERTGLLLPPGDVSSWCAALGRIVEDAGLRARLGAEGPSRIQEGFAADQMVAAYEGLYRELLDRP